MALNMVVKSMTPPQQPVSSQQSALQNTGNNQVISNGAHGGSHYQLWPDGANFDLSVFMSEEQVNFNTLTSTL